MPPATRRGHDAAPCHCGGSFAGRSVKDRPTDLQSSSENEKAWTLSIGLAPFRPLHHVDWNLATAATMVTLMPVVILFFFAQRAFIQAVTLTGVKGVARA